MNRHTVAVLILAASTVAISAQQPQVSNTQFHTEPAGTGLSATVDRFRQSNQPVWIGYSVPALPGIHLSSCGSWNNSSATDDGCCGEYQLEGSQHDIEKGTKYPSSVSEINVLLRVENGVLRKVRAVTASCKLNAGGVAFDWINGVSGEESVAFLGATVAGMSESDGKRLLDETLATLSMHATPKATEELVKLANLPHSFALREKTAFWLGAQRGREGFLALKQLAQHEPDSAFREKLAFDIYVNSDPGTTNELIQMAKADPDAKVRRQAIFWLAQKAGQKASETLKNAVENDPDLAVKKQAVFGLSQMPKDEGIPQLIHVADTSSNPTLRKEAIFWLGQTKDPRALQYIEQVLQR